MLGVSFFVMGKDTADLAAGDQYATETGSDRTVRDPSVYK